MFLTTQTNVCTIYLEHIFEGVEPVTTLTYRRYQQTRSFSFTQLYNMLLNSVNGHGLFYGNIIWFLMVFAMTRIYLWRICSG